MSNINLCLYKTKEGLLAALITLALFVMPFTAKTAPGVGAIQVFAGSGYTGSVDGPSVDARFNSPTALTIHGNDLWVIDDQETLIRHLDIENGITSTLEGMTKTAKSARIRFGQIKAFRKGKALLVTVPQKREILETPSDHWQPVTVIRNSNCDIVGIIEKSQRIILRDLQTSELFWSNFPSNGKGMKVHKVCGGIKSDAADVDGTTIFSFTVEPPTVNTIEDMPNGLSWTASNMLRGLNLDKKNAMPIFRAVSFKDGTQKCYFVDRFQRSFSFCLRNDPSKTGREWRYRLMVIPNFRGLNLGSGDFLSPLSIISGMEISPERRSIVVSDSINNRLLIIKDYEFQESRFEDSAPIFGHDYTHPEKKPVNVKRIINYGSSFAMHALWENGKFDNLTKQIEQYLNLKQISQGTGKEIEVIFDGEWAGNSGFRDDDFSIAITRIDTRKPWSPDMVMLTAALQDLIFSLLSYFYRPAGEGGVPVGGVDPDFAFETNPEKRYKGDVLKLYQFIKKHENEYAPDLGFDDKGGVKYDFDGEFFRLFENKEFMDFCAPYFGKWFRAFDEAVQKSMPGTPVLVVLYPARNQFGFQAVKKDSAAFNRMTHIPNIQLKPILDSYSSKTFHILDLSEKIRRNNLSFHPVYLTDVHMDKWGCEFEGYLTAEEIWKMGILGNNRKSGENRNEDQNRGIKQRLK